MVDPSLSIPLGAGEPGTVGEKHCWSGVDVRGLDVCVLADGGLEVRALDVGAPEDGASEDSALEDGALEDAALCAGAR
jgi:hypothetical protein